MPDCRIASTSTRSCRDGVTASMKFGQVYQSEAGYSLERRSHYSQEPLCALTSLKTKEQIALTRR